MFKDLHRSLSQQACDIWDNRKYWSVGQTSNKQENSAHRIKLFMQALSKHNFTDKSFYPVWLSHQKLGMKIDRDDHHRYRAALKSIDWDNPELA